MANGDATIKITVHFLGPAKDLAGAGSVTLSLPLGATVLDVRSTLAERFPRLGAALPRARMAVNDEFAADNLVLDSGAEVAVIPPVSGGSGVPAVWVELIHAPIPYDQVTAFIHGDAKLGGIVIFEGATRQESDPEHGPLVYLDYEAHASMAVRQLERMARVARERWLLGRLAFLHRLGRVAPAEVSVVVAVAAGHRGPAFEAVQWFIDALKKDVPIWKKDVFSDGHMRWVEPR